MFFLFVAVIILLIIFIRFQICNNQKYGNKNSIKNGGKKKKKKKKKKKARRKKKKKGKSTSAPTTSASTSFTISSESKIYETIFNIWNNYIHIILENTADKQKIILDLQNKLNQSRNNIEIIIKLFNCNINTLFNNNCKNLIELHSQLLKTFKANGPSESNIPPPLIDLDNLILILTDNGPVNETHNDPNNNIFWKDKYNLILLLILAFHIFIKIIKNSDSKKIINLFSYINYGTIIFSMIDINYINPWNANSKNYLSKLSKSKSVPELLLMINNLFLNFYKKIDKIRNYVNNDTIEKITKYSILVDKIVEIFMNLFNFLNDKQIYNNFKEIEKKDFNDVSNTDTKNILYIYNIFYKCFISTINLPDAATSDTVDTADAATIDTADAKIIDNSKFINIDFNKLIIEESETTSMGIASTLMGFNMINYIIYYAVNFIIKLLTFIYNYEDSVIIKMTNYFSASENNSKKQSYIDLLEEFFLKNININDILSYFKTPNNSYYNLSKLIFNRKINVKIIRKMIELYNDNDDIKYNVYNIVKLYIIMYIIGSCQTIKCEKTDKQKIELFLKIILQFDDKNIEKIVKIFLYIIDMLNECIEIGSITLCNDKDTCLETKITDNNIFTLLIPESDINDLKNKIIKAKLEAKIELEIKSQQGALKEANTADSLLKDCKDLISRCQNHTDYEKNLILDTGKDAKKYEANAAKHRAAAAVHEKNIQKMQQQILKLDSQR
jgi:hypothetical protein